ncbi:MAG TPA: hypothetical protein VNW97_15115 [Candidatus Saccharimonadales bacterium]|nr:hypothetical protein [Candidatus Saccharimonadales bacterium]
MRTIDPDELRACFPKLVSGTYKPASKATARYNCMGFANDDERHWWEPGLYGGRYHWPPTIRQQDTLESWVELFTSQGYTQVEGRDIEPGFEKIAIFVNLTDMSPTHVAKSDGNIWKSKLGKGQDIEHISLEVLEGDQGDEYGVVERVMRRPLKRT